MSENQEQELEFDLSHYVEMFMRRRWIVLSAWLSVIIVTAIVTFNMRPVYQAQALLVIEKERGNNVIYQTGPTVERGNEDYYQTQYKLLKSEALLKQVHKRLELEKVPEFAGVYGYRRLIKPISVAPVPRSRLVYIKTDSYDPLLAARISNMVATVFIEQNLSNQLFISKDVLNALQAEKAGRDSRAVYESLPAVVNNPMIQQLKQDAAKLQALVAEASGRYTPRHPQVVAMTANLKALQDQIKTETDRIIQSLKIDLSGQLMGNNIRLVDAAVPALSPIKPRKAFNLLLALIGGFVLGMFAAVIVEFIDQTVRTQEDVENKLGLPFLGVVPFTPFSAKKQSAYHHLLQKEHSLVAESVRNLRTMVDFAEVSQKSKSFLVTSTVQGEGKSYICANLAVAIAQAGEKVLMIEGDLRRSNLHKTMRMSNTRGISEFLAAGKTVDDVLPLIQKSEDIPNLHLLTCGPRPPNPAELLNTPRLPALLDWAHKNYDRVVIDCPPMFPISDALLWGKYISGAVYVINFGKTRVPLIRNAAKRLTGAGIKILGSVVNMSRFGGLAYSYYGYYQYKYNYNYNYAYAPEPDDSDGGDNAGDKPAEARKKTAKQPA
jgi:capsular exopolysaccharide synthesis family protein